MDESKIVASLEQFTADEIDAMGEEFHAFARHRRVEASNPTAQRAPFNRKQFFANVWKLIQVIGPAVGPLLGADTKPADPARHE